MVSTDTAPVDIRKNGSLKQILRSVFIEKNKQIFSINFIIIVIPVKMLYRFINSDKFSLNNQRKVTYTVCFFRFEEIIIKTAYYSIH